MGGGVQPRGLDQLGKGGGGVEKKLAQLIMSIKTLLRLSQ